MEYIYAAMLLHKAGQNVDEGNIEKVLTAAGVKVDKARFALLVAFYKEILMRISMTFYETIIFKIIKQLIRRSFLVLLFLKFQLKIYRNVCL